PRNERRQRAPPPTRRRARPRTRATSRPRVACARRRSRSFLDLGHAERVEQWLDRAIENRRQIMGRETDAMIGHATLRIIIGAYLRRAISGANLRFSHSGTLGLLLGDPQVEESRARDL